MSHTVNSVNLTRDSRKNNKILCKMLDHTSRSAQGHQDLPDGFVRFVGEHWEGGAKGTHLTQGGMGMTWYVVNIINCECPKTRSKKTIAHSHVSRQNSPRPRSRPCLTAALPGRRVTVSVISIEDFLPFLHFYPQLPSLKYCLNDGYWWKKVYTTMFLGCCIYDIIRPKSCTQFPNASDLVPSAYADSTPCFSFLAKLLHLTRN